MTIDEVIILNEIPHDKYSEIATNAVRYALISVGFTYNRMDKTELISRIKNIIKGKIAEGIFFYYCSEKGILIDTKACTTPFWLPDLKDFVWLGGEWDIKNNYFYCSDSDFLVYDFTMLPALIPNKTYWDQWSKRNDTLIETSRFCAYLFTFIRLTPDKKDFFTLNLSKAQFNFLSNIESSSKNAPHGEMPFMEKWFFEEMAKNGSEKYIHLLYMPEMVITGCANSRYFQLFKNTSANDTDIHYKNFDHTYSWYESEKNVLKFMNGSLTTKIQNMTCPVKLLPSFKSVAKNAYNL